jgi:hypothetical protein
MELLQSLETVKKNLEYDNIVKWAGLCYNLELVGFSDTQGKELRSLFRSWPKFSGDIEYPVHGGIKNMAKHVYGTTGNLWNQKTTYGRNRLELLNWCIKQLKTKEKPIEYKAGQRFKIQYKNDYDTREVILANVSRWNYALIDLTNGNRIVDPIEVPRGNITEAHMKQMLDSFKIVS